MYSCQLDLVDTDLSANPELKDTLQKIRVTTFDFQYIRQVCTKQWKISYKRTEGRRPICPLNRAFAVLIYGRESENSVGQTIEHGRSTIIWFLGELFLTIYSAEFKNLSNTCGRYIIVSIKSCTKTLVSNRSNIRLPITD